MAYLLDADVLIRAKNLHYGFDFCPAFWDWLVRENRAGQVYSIERVGGELLAGADELADWAKARGAGFFLRPEPAVIQALSLVSNWVSGQRYTQSAINTFFQTADYYLVAQAYAGQYAVVTHEIRSDSQNKVKIPDVCIGMGVTCVAPHEMLRTARARFVLGA